MEDQPRTRYVVVDDADVAYQVIGDGPIDLVYHHGLCQIDLQWDVAPEAAFNRRLASFTRLILFDRRGSGASERGAVSSPLGWEHWGEDLLGVLDAVGSDRAAIFAEAEAGATAVLFAAAHPERVNALILGNTQARMARADDYPIGMGADEVEMLLQLIDTGWGDPASLAFVFPSLAGNESVLASLARLCRAAASPRQASALYRYIVGELDVRKVLPLVQTPTLVLHNDYVDAGRAQYLSDHIVGARLVRVPGNDVLFFGGDHEPVISEVGHFLTGDRLPTEVDRILTTVLFTDIVGSTERAASLGDSRWRSLLDTHDQVVREQLRRFRGREIKTTGDGFVASFDGPARAIRCAQATVEATKPLGIDLRLGLHTGECEVRGDDLGGLAVHIAARVGAMAGPGDVLVSGTVKDLVVGSGIQFDDRGDHNLKGVPGTWRLFAARS